VARALLFTEIVLATIFEYRTLLGKCDRGDGLELDEIGRLAEIEREYAPTGEGPRGRKFRREVVQLHGIIRGECMNDSVELIEVGPGGFVCRKAPYIARGEQVEIVIEDGDCSYRFRAAGVWLKDDGEDYKVGLALIGMPVCLHNVRLRRHEADIVDKIVSAAA
jgi:hypothetical protein